MILASCIRSLEGLKIIEINTLRKIKNTYNTYGASALTSLWKLKSAVVQEIMKTKGASVNISHDGLRKSVLQ